MSLLEEVKGIKTGKNLVRPELTPEQIDVAVAWAKGEVSFAQIQKGLKIPAGKVNGFLLSALRAKVQSL